MINTTLSQLHQLKLSGMAKALQQQLEQPGQYEELSFSERLQLLADQEVYERDHRKQQRLLKQAQLKLAATAQDIDYQHPRGLQKSVVTGLLQCDWLRRHQNLLLTGPCGTGKTYIACALANTACLKGFSVKYYRISRLLMELAQTKADGTYHRKLKNLAKLDLLILDDWGLEPLKAAQRNDLMEIMDDRHGSSSTVLISQLPTDQWYQSIGDNTLADAILDRLMHNAHRIKLTGESMRKKLADVDAT
ncbi:IS21-like element helper ATPase IstB [Vibrio diazotrophicus]|jgi:DNA replication protein DnaC|uniref:ATP-binding protein n=1 Tax=Vibrio diazotrophicus TaxID=685 RepID=A0ABX4W472_VIBDI|nr:ATP-binding protein [Vibrio diazotrophicus]